MTKRLTVRRLQALSAERNYTKHWSLSDWGNALAGETGEVCNLIKKITRGDYATDPAKATALLASELPDVLTYLCLLASAAGIDLQDCTVEKFNAVSTRLGSPVKAP
jgi:NTP pyrophosphatase (non-canonical NTP hydrolase)